MGKLHIHAVKCTLDHTCWPDGHNVGCKTLVKTIFSILKMPSLSICWFWWKAAVFVSVEKLSTVVTCVCVCAACGSGKADAGSSESMCCCFLLRSCDAKCTERESLFVAVLSCVDVRDFS